MKFRLNTCKYIHNQVRKILRKHDLPERAWCIVHGGKCCIAQTDLHIAGHTCVDHSPLGKRKKAQGPHMKYFLIWTANIRKRRFKIVVGENVKEFPMSLYESEVGDMYIIIKTVVSAARQGWATERTSQYTEYTYEKL